MDKAVILAAGLGTRMRRGAERLPRDLASVAHTGIKALMPVGTARRPFLDYSLHALADVGLRRVCLVVGPDHDALRSYCVGLTAERLEIVFAVQAEPRGTADAVLAAKSFAGDDPFVVINSDNYYPPEALRLLLELDGPGLVGFDRRMLQSGETNIPAERAAAFAVIDAPGGELRRIVEKPDAATLQSFPEPVLLSLNCWRFSPRIFAACASVPLSPRGELELTAAVELAVTAGERFRVVPSAAPVLDLTSPEDVAEVEARLRGVDVSL